MSSNIQNDIMHMILARLDLTEVMSVAAVGGRWSDSVRSFVNDNKLTVRHRSWLVLSDDPLKDTVALLNPLQHWTFGLDRRFCGALGDWIAINETVDGLYLFHPLRRPYIPLPPVTTLPNHNNRFDYHNLHFVNKVILSSPQPSAGRVVAIIFGDGALAFCRLGDTRWTEFEPDIEIERRYEDACFYNGELVAVDSDEFVWAFGFSLGLDERRVVFEPPDSWDVQRYGIRYLVESMGQLLMVIRKRRVVGTRVGLFRRFVSLINTYGFRVYQLEVNGGGFSRLERLGERVMFLGSALSVLLPAEEIKENFCSDCIYYAECKEKTPWEPVDMGVFWMADRRLIQLLDRDDDYGVDCRSHFAPVVPLFFCMADYNCGG